MAEPATRGSRFLGAILNALFTLRTHLHIHTMAVCARCWREQCERPAQQALDEVESKPKNGHHSALTGSYIILLCAHWREMQMKWTHPDNSRLIFNETNASPPLVGVVALRSLTDDLHNCRAFILYSMANNKYNFRAVKILHCVDDERLYRLVMAREGAFRRNERRRSVNAHLYVIRTQYSIQIYVSV